MADGWTALHYASMNGFARIVEYLVKEGGADVNVQDRLFRNALHWAARFNNTKMAEVLLKLGIRY